MERLESAREPRPGTPTTPRWPCSTTPRRLALPRRRGAALAGNARTTYASQWKRFVSWCEERGVDPRAVDAVQVAAYLAEGLKPGSCRPCRPSAAAIAAAARAAGLMTRAIGPANPGHSGAACGPAGCDSGCNQGVVVRIARRHGALSRGSKNERSNDGTITVGKNRPAKPKTYQFWGRKDMRTCVRIRRKVGLPR